MSTNRLYDSLLSLPLFLGMTRYDFQNVAGKTRFDFQKLEAGETIVEEGTSCTRLYYLISGDIKVITQADDYGYQVEEDISAPESFQLERLFGLTQRFTHTYVAKNNCSIMSVSKQEIMKLSDEYEIFRINLLNLVCTQSQKNNRRLFRVPAKTLSERLIRFFESHSVRPAGENLSYQDDPFSRRDECKAHLCIQSPQRTTIRRTYPARTRQNLYPCTGKSHQTLKKV